MTIATNITYLKAKLLNASIVVTSLFGYLEWGGDNSDFLFSVEAELFTKLFTQPSSVLHPLTLLPLLGQLLLVATLFQHKPGKKLTILGMLAKAAKKKTKQRK